MRFKVWSDDHDELGFDAEIEARDMPEALDSAAVQLGYIDYVDLAQGMEWGDDEGLNITLLSENDT